MSKHYQKWRAMAPLGLTTIGLGASLLGEAISMKQQRKPLWQWFVMGTISLCCINAGISIFGDAVKERVLYELEEG